MEILCVGNSIKEALSAQQCLETMIAGVGSDWAGSKSGFLVSDGGEGFLDAYSFYHPLKLNYIKSIGALGDVITCEIGIDHDNKIAVIETAKAIGLAQIDPARRNIMLSSSAGVAYLIYSAVKLGCTEIIIGLGGSATNDGGIGLLWQLAELFGICQFGCPEVRTAVDMADLPSPDIKELRTRFKEVKLVVCADVDNILLGPGGSAQCFASQKGAQPAELDQLEAFMTEWSDRVERNAGGHWRTNPGAGAAGGLGFALMALGAQAVSGSDFIMKMSGLIEAIRREHVVMTAEGKFDQTSLGGKAPWKVAQLAKSVGAKAVIFCAVSDENAVDIARSQDIEVIEFSSVRSDQSQRLVETAQQLSNAVQAYCRNSLR